MGKVSRVTSVSRHFGERNFLVGCAGAFLIFWGQIFFVLAVLAAWRLLFPPSEGIPGTVGGGPVPTINDVIAFLQAVAVLPSWLGMAVVGLGVTIAGAWVIGRTPFLPSAPMNAITALAAALTGLATVALALLTYIVIRENRRLIAATLEEATATREQADATAEQATVAKQMLHEVQVDRELGNAPFLVFRFRAGFQGGGEPVSPTVELANIGHGPALNCLYVAQAVWPDQRVGQGATHGSTRPMETRYYRYPGARKYALPVHLGAGEKDTGSIEETQVTDLAAGGALVALGWAEGIREGALCEDQFGTRYFFQQGHAQPQTWHSRDERQQPG